uniref:Uncharacterized protein n=1 Tax=Hippocampus comes TaxID=109280 RepID=A0A3Q2YRV6_HIPCM
MYFHKQLSSCRSQTNVGLLTTINLGCLFSSFSAPSVKAGSVRADTSHSRIVGECSPQHLPKCSLCLTLKCRYGMPE